MTRCHRYVLDAPKRRPRAPRIPYSAHLSQPTREIVAAELRFSAAKSASKLLVERVELVLSAIDTLPLEPPADRHYAPIRQSLSQQGALIRPNDLLIAAHALALERTVVTANERKFGRVTGLKVENSLASPPITDP